VLASSVPAISLLGGDIARVIHCCFHWLFFGLFAGSASAEVDPSLAKRSAVLTQNYLQTWSSNARVALAQVPHLYAPRVSFYRRLLNHNQLIREKAHFVRRWPIRQYSVRPGTTRGLRLTKPTMHRTFDH
jgi:hypothetical protein